MKHVQVLIINSWTFDLNRKRLTLGTKPKPRLKHRTGKFVSARKSASSTLYTISTYSTLSYEFKNRQIYMHIF